MTTPTSPAVEAAVPPLTPRQRIVLRELLHEMWRDHVRDITTLAVRYHDSEDPDVAARLAHVRRDLVDVEAALGRLDSGSYGNCDGCERRMPFEQLEAAPDGRYCRRCRR